MLEAVLSMLMYTPVVLLIQQTISPIGIIINQPQNKSKFINIRW